MIVGLVSDAFVDEAVGVDEELANVFIFQLRNDPPAVWERLDLAGLVEDVLDYLPGVVLRVAGDLVEDSSEIPGGGGRPGHHVSMSRRTSSVVWVGSSRADSLPSRTFLRT